VIRAPARAILALTFMLMAVAALGWAVVHPKNDASAPLQESRRPPLLLLTSLPLIFGEDFSLNGGGSIALKALQSRYRVLPISTTSPSELKRARLLLMAQPQAQTAENLVALDAWVRRGGRVLLLADPLLEWPSKLPLGDPSRPTPIFPDTGLLAHWGLRLDLPSGRGTVMRSLGGRNIMAVSPGRLSGSCPITSDGLVAHCRIGAGRVTVVGDADFLDMSALPAGAQQNLSALLDELAKLESA